MTREPLVHVVDDDDAVRESLCALLEISGYRVTGFADAAAFRGRARDEEPVCVFLDVRLPDGSGLDINRELHVALPTLPVIIMTGHGDVPMAVDAMREGAADFIEKPFEGGRMAEALTRALSRTPTVVPADADIRARFAPLTPRETDVMRGMVAGNPTKIIAHELGLSPRTVEIHRGRVMKKTDAASLSELVKMAMQAGILT